MQLSHELHKRACVTYQGKENFNTNTAFRREIQTKISEAYTEFNQ